MEERSAQLTDGLQVLAERFSRPVVINRVGSVFALYMTDKPVLSHKELESSDGEAYCRFVRGLLKEGVLLPQQPGGTAFVSSTHGAKDIEETLLACERVLMQLHQEDLP